MSVSFNLHSGVKATNFIRSQFDYGTRQRRTVNGYDSYSVKLILSQSEMTDFERFWKALNDGNDKFYTDEVIGADTTVPKIARFTSGYEVSHLGANKFTVSVPIELIETGV